MAGFFAKLFGGSKSERDIKVLRPRVEKINSYFAAYQSLSNDELRAKTQEFKQRIKEYLKDTDSEIEQLTKEAEALDFSEINKKEELYYDSSPQGRFSHGLMYHGYFTISSFCPTSFYQNKIHKTTINLPTFLL